MPVLNAGSYDKRGYHLTFINGKQTRTHILVAEAMLGRKMQATEVIHHRNGVLADNRPENLLVCTQAEHLLIHKRERALLACGNANWQKCPYCKAYANPCDMKKGSRNWFYHPKCKQAYNVAYNQKHKL